MKTYSVKINDNIKPNTQICVNLLVSNDVTKDTMIANLNRTKYILSCSLQDYTSYDAYTKQFGKNIKPYEFDTFKAVYTKNRIETFLRYIERQYHYIQKINITPDITIDLE